MTDKTDSVLDDIAFMRALAEAGSDGGGSTVPFFLSGLMFGGAALFHWAFLTGLIHVGWLAVNMAWLGASAAFMIVLLVFTRRFTKPNTVMSASRIGMSFAIYLLLFVFGYATWKLRSNAVMELFMATVFAVYGASWVVGAKVLARPALNWIAALSYASAVVVVLLITNPNVYLFDAAALIVVTFTPGLMLRRRRAAR